MERRSFIKNIFGSVIGFAILPTALTEFVKPAESAEASLINKFLVDISKFEKGDILKFDNGDTYYLVSKMNNECRCKNLSDPMKEVILVHKTGNENKKIMRFASAMGEASLERF